MRKISTAMTIVAALFVASCAGYPAPSGPTFSTIQQTLPTLTQDQGRIYFYRWGPLIGVGYARFQPEIRLNGNVVGTSQPHGVFFKDAKPGDYVVATSTEVERQLSFTLAAGQTRYVETTVSLGLFAAYVIPNLVEPAVGRKAIQDLSYTGGGTSGGGGS